MRRRTLARDIFWTAVVFVILVLFTAIIIFGENFLENFKSHA
jgi:hypothetical protein